MCAFEPQKRASMRYVVEHLKQFATAERERSSTSGNSPSKASFTSVSVNLHEFVVPELSSTIEDFLKKLQTRCSQAADAHDTVLHVHAFDSLLRTASDTSVIQRAKSRKASLKDNVLYREIDGLLELLNVEDIDPVHKWRPEIETNASTDISLQRTVNEESTTGSHEKAESCGVMKFLHFERNKFNRKFDAIGTKLIRDDAQKSTHPPRHIPIHELKYTRKDIIGDDGAFGEGHLGTWLGTSVVVKFMGYEDDEDTEKE